MALVNEKLNFEEGDIVEFRNTPGRGRLMRGIVFRKVSDSAVDIYRTTTAERMRIKPATIEKVARRHRARRGRPAAS